MGVYSTEGDSGDTVFLLNILKHLPNGPHTLLFEPSTMTKSTPEGLDKLVGDLIRQQPYIKECRPARPDDKIDWHSAQFRSVRHYTPGETLMQAHLNHYCMVKQTALKIPGDTPWLTVSPSPLSKGRVIVNRTGRYRNDRFPWAKVVDHYKHLLLFVGLHHEWRETCGLFGYMDFMPTENMLQVAELIAGSELFIGNQSCAFAIAEGLKHPRIQETHLVFPDCIFPTAEGYPAAQHIATDEVVLPAVGSRPTVTFPSEDPVFKPLDSTRVPPGSWQYPGHKKNPSLRHVAIEVAKSNSVSVEQAERMVYEYQCLRLPDFFAAEIYGLERFKKAVDRVKDFR